MFSISKVKCPHCGIEGQVMIPQADAIIVGPCPECEKLVVIFAGMALPLDTQLMEKASQDEAYNHVLGVLTTHLKECMDTLFGRLEKSKKKRPPRASKNQADPGAPHISTGEIAAFVSEELPLIDNSDYFRAIFG